MKDINELNQLLDDFKNGKLETDSSKIFDLQGREIYLYGAGNIGKRLYVALRDNGISIAGFIDQNPNINISDIRVPVYLPDDPALIVKRGTCTVILSGLFSLRVCKDIKKNLKAIGFANVYALHDDSFNQVINDVFRESLSDDTYKNVDVLGSDRKKLEQAFNLLQGDQDRALFLNYLKAHLMMDFTQMAEPYDISLQYLAHDIDEVKDYSNFVDCGGYDGDTFRQLIARGGRVQNLVAFEPQADLYRQYAQTVANHLSSIQQALLYPCGVYSETVQLKFKSNNDALSSSRVSNEGDDIIQCVKLDEALVGFVPSLIKMDIEGAEVEALNGARQLIERHGPALAICVYHRMSDLWEIPYLIHSIRSDYRYYLRNYNYMGFETVLYAFCG